MSKERVSGNFKTGGFTHRHWIGTTQKVVDKGRTDNVPKVDSLNRVISAFFYHIKLVFGVRIPVWYSRSFKSWALTGEVKLGST